MGAGVAPKGGGGRRGRRGRRQLSDINVTPLVDVMLVLLIVFMVTAPLLTTGVAVDLPSSQSSPLPGQDEPLAVTVTAKGEIFVQDSPIALDQLGPRLMAITNRNPNARIFVRGDKAVDYGQVMAAVSAINRAGFTKVALLTDSQPQTPPQQGSRRAPATQKAEAGR